MRSSTLLAFAGDAILCGHNLQFDLRFLDRELRTLGMRVAAPVLDTLRLARRLLSGRSERLGLGDLCRAPRHPDPAGAPGVDRTHVPQRSCSTGC